MQGADSPEVMGDLLLGEGKLAAFHRDPAKSELLFTRALQIAQQHGQTFLASNALGNLGMLQMQQYHYADAVDLFNATLAAAQKLDAQASIVKTTVNLGWAYLRMGDLDRASELFEESEKRSKQLGMITDQRLHSSSIAANPDSIQHYFSDASKRLSAGFAVGAASRQSAGSCFQPQRPRTNCDRRRRLSS